MALTTTVTCPRCIVVSWLVVIYSVVYMLWSYCWCIIFQNISNCIVICLPAFQMTIIDVPVPDQVPPPSIDSVEESCIPLENQHSPSPDVAVVEKDVPPNAHPPINKLPILAIIWRKPIPYNMPPKKRPNRATNAPQSPYVLLVVLNLALFTCPLICKTRTPCGPQMRWGSCRKVTTTPSSLSFAPNPLRSLDSLFLFAVSRPTWRSVQLLIPTSRCWRTSSSKVIGKEIEYCTCLLSTYQIMT